MQTARAAIFAGVMLVVGISGTAGRFTQNDEGSLGAGSSQRLPSSAIETAYATVGTLSRDNTATSQPEPSLTCDDLKVWFLNPTCSKKHKKIARLNHRVATVVIARTPTTATSD